MPEIQVLKVGPTGREDMPHITSEMIADIARSYDADWFIPSLTVGHPDGSGYESSGDVMGLRATDSALYATIENIPPELAEAVNNRRYKYVSSGLSKSDDRGIYLHHVALTNAPQLKGMEPPRFSGEAEICFCESVGVTGKIGGDAAKCNGGGENDMPSPVEEKVTRWSLAFGDGAEKFTEMQGEVKHLAELNVQLAEENKALQERMQKLEADSKRDQAVKFADDAIVASGKRISKASRNAVIAFAEDLPQNEETQSKLKSLVASLSDVPDSLDEDTTPQANGQTADVSVHERGWNEWGKQHYSESIQRFVKNGDSVDLAESKAFAEFERVWNAEDLSKLLIEKGVLS